MGLRQTVGVMILDVMACCIEARLNVSTWQSLASHLEVVTELNSAD
jgi:hypothetical protein